MKDNKKTVVVETDESKLPLDKLPGIIKSLEKKSEENK